MRNFIFFLLLFVANLNFAQSTSTAITSSKHDYIRCINMEEYEQILQKQDPGRKVRRDEALKMVDTWLQAKKMNSASAIDSEYNIPIVFHVLWNSSTPAEKISLAQIKRQVKVLNEDYNRLNSDTTGTPAAFKPAASSFHITFCLAQTDPNGKATTGVVYKQTSTTAFSNISNNAKRPALGGDTVWDPNKYLNIWVCNIFDQFGNPLLGYSEFPTSPLDNTFGSVIRYEAIGDSGYLPIPAYNLGRTVTHEIGHLLNLHHPWGDDGGKCPGSGGADDGCADTPPEGNSKNDGYGDGSGPTFGCPSFPYTDNCSTTSPGIMIENYMEYTNDNCMNLFTKDQYAIAYAVLNGPLAKLAASTACIAPNSIEEQLFTSSIKIYPNPSIGKFVLSINSANSSSINIEVSDLLGQCILTQKAYRSHNYTCELDLSAYSNGLYFVRLTDGTFSTVKKIMISR